jgi:glutathione S-transferase
MRYRRLPYVFQIRTPAVAAELQRLQPALVPVLQFPEDGSLHVDSTPLIYLLERRHPGRRSVVPGDPGLALLAHLLEDLADEWITKCMFHYRWQTPQDGAFAARWLEASHRPGQSDAQLRDHMADFTERQVSRLALVGCTEENRPLIEGTFRRLLAILERHVTTVGDFLFGTRPSLAEFALLGQLYPMSLDPTPMALMRETAPFTYLWVERMGDTSGVEGTWRGAEEPHPPAVVDLLRMAGTYYLPFLQANARALANGEPMVEVTLDGQPFRQGAFKYQGKCLKWLREELASLSPGPQGRIEPLLRETGCWESLAG